MNLLLSHFQKAPRPVTTSEVCGRRTEVDEGIMCYGWDVWLSCARCLNQTWYIAAAVYCTVSGYIRNVKRALITWCSVFLVILNNSSSRPSAAIKQQSLFCVQCWSTGSMEWHRLCHLSRCVTRNSSGDEIANVNFLYDDIVHAVKIQ